MSEFHGDIPFEEYVLSPGHWDITGKKINNVDIVTFRFIIEKDQLLKKIRIEDYKIIKAKKVEDL